MNKKIVLCGGGSAGHVMPNVALLPDLKKHFDQIHYIGTSGIEKEIISGQDGVVYHQMQMEKFRRNLSLKNLILPIAFAKSVLSAKKILKEIKPNVVFSKGGFASLPVCYGAKKLKIPVVSHESDLSLGLANKLIYPVCDTMFCTYNTTTKFGKKCVCSGNILRKEIFNGNKNDAIKKYNLNPNKKTLLIIGGSLGSANINSACFKIADKLCKEFNVLHICGKGKTNKNINFQDYHQIEFESKIWNVFACADLCISRAGSNVIFELLALNKPMLLIPLSKKSSRGDQILNAKNFEENGYAIVLNEENLSPASLLKAVDKLKNFKPKQQNTKAIGNSIILEKLKNL